MLSRLVLPIESLHRMLRLLPRDQLSLARAKALQLLVYRGRAAPPFLFRSRVYVLKYELAHR